MDAPPPDARCAIARRGRGDCHAARLRGLEERTAPRGPGQRRGAARSIRSHFRKALDAADRRLTRAGQDPQRLLAEELAFFEEIQNQPGDDPQIRYERAIAGRRAGDVERLLGKTPEARATYQNAIRLLSDLAASDPSVADYRRDLAAAHDGLAARLCQDAASSTWPSKSFAPARRCSNSSRKSIPKKWITAASWAWCGITWRSISAAWVAWLMRWGFTSKRSRCGAN